jgi:peroxiredoxin
MPEVGEQSPDFTLDGTDGRTSLEETNRGQKVILAFYIEDNTPG